MREIEPQPVGRHQTALLRHMVAKMMAKRLVQQVGRAVIGAKRGAPVLRRPEDERMSPTDTEPDWISIWWACSRPSGLRVSVTVAAKPSAPEIRPASPIWPPLSP